MKILHLILKGKWYDMIVSGEKPEEYREIIPYWEKRLLNYSAIKADYQRLAMRKFLLGSACRDVCAEYSRGYTHVCFHRGYTSTTTTYEYKGMTIGKGRPEWGAPEDKEVFIIKLGKRI